MLYPNLAIVRYHPCTHGLQEDDCAFYSSGKPLTFQVGDLQFQLDVDEIYRGLPRDGKYAIGRASEEEIRNVLLNWQNPTQEI
ncbi:MAG TPA: hypothetical protein VKR06_42580 [Ktedonosporobacter sp.]|nr:hypothetical protein [Ktedonosporobacter sp.]